MQAISLPKNQSRQKQQPNTINNKHKLQETNTQQPTDTTRKSPRALFAFARARGRLVASPGAVLRGVPSLARARPTGLPRAGPGDPGGADRSEGAEGDRGDVHRNGKRGGKRERKEELRTGGLFLDPLVDGSMFREASHLGCLNQRSGGLFTLAHFGFPHQHLCGVSDLDKHPRSPLAGCAQDRLGEANGIIQQLEQQRALLQEPRSPKAQPSERKPRVQQKAVPLCISISKEMEDQKKEDSLLDGVENRTHTHTPFRGHLLGGLIAHVAVGFRL